MITFKIMLFKSEGIVLVAKIYSSGLMGVNGYTVEVEVDTKVKVCLALKLLDFQTVL